MRISGKVVIEADVLLDNHNQVLDSLIGLAPAAFLAHQTDLNDGD